MTVKIDKDVCICEGQMRFDMLDTYELEYITYPVVNDVTEE